mmetsp:Transcript_27332/g.61715  ORF Transcript_27332/g.61715 Transcript_27332/m.61715 type:complete len:109 (+) Transcript_27332:40-366(+)
MPPGGQATQFTPSQIDRIKCEAIEKEARNIRFRTEFTLNPKSLEMVSNKPNPRCPTAPSPRRSGAASAPPPAPPWQVRDRPWWASVRRPRAAGRAGPRRRQRRPPDRR